MSKVPYVSHGYMNKNMKLEKRYSSITSTSRIPWQNLDSSYVQLLINREGSEKSMEKIKW